MPDTGAKGQSMDCSSLKKVSRGFMGNGRWWWIEAFYSGVMLEKGWQISNLFFLKMNHAKKRKTPSSRAFSFFPNRTIISSSCVGGRARHSTHPTSQFQSEFQILKQPKTSLCQPPTQ